MKAQADIISAIIIVVIALSLVATAYTWGIPLIQKRQDMAKADRVASYFDPNNANSIVRRIEYIANNGGEDTFSSEVDGAWVLHPHNESSPSNNSMDFNFFSKVSNVAMDTGWVSLTTGASCPPATGIVGIDSSSVVCARADSFGAGYNITYRVWFREIDVNEEKGYKINLVRHAAGPLISAGKSMRISYEKVYTCSALECGKTLIITEIKILLE